MNLAAVLVIEPLMGRWVFLDVLDVFVLSDFTSSTLVQDVIIRAFSRSLLCCPGLHYTSLFVEDAVRAVSVTENDITADFSCAAS